MARLVTNRKFLLFLGALLMVFDAFNYIHSMKSLSHGDKEANAFNGHDFVTTSNSSIEYLVLNDGKANAINPNNNANNTIVSTPIPNETDKPAYLTMYGAHRAEKSFALLPKWLQTYFEWHGEQTRNLSHDTKYVVLACHKNNCGGVSDRLRHLPFFLLYASLAKRVLCIHWTKPYGLENYLTPPMYAAGRMVDWRCPADTPLSNEAYFHLECFADGYDLNCLEEDINRMRMMNDTYAFLDIPRTTDRINHANNLFQLHSYANEVPILSQWQFVDLMGDVFRVMFEPVLALTQNINDTMTALGLKENEYTSVHLRSRYPFFKHWKKIDKQGGLDFPKWKRHFRPIIDNAVSCANHIAMNSTIYFVSDNHEVVIDAITRDIPVGGGMQVRPVGIRRDKEPLHSDGKNPKAQISDFFPLFEDLLIMGGGKCVAHGLGSFGAFGAGLSGNRCRIIHQKYNTESIECPNSRADLGCKHNTEFHKGKILFDSEVDREGLVSSSRCNRLR